MTSGQELELMAPGKIVDLLGRRLYVNTIVTYSDNMCVICLAEFTASAQVCSTSCGHLFHCTCLEEWLQAKDQHPSCPLYPPHRCGRHPLDNSQTAYCPTAPTNLN